MADNDEDFRVIWAVDVTAGSPTEAAKKARDFQTDPDNIANSLFNVYRRNELNKKPEIIDLEVSRDNIH